MTEKSLDPEDWPEFRTLAHEMLDTALDHMEGYGDGPVWQKMPDEVKSVLQEPLPMKPQGSAAVAQELRDNILPYGVGNTHPKFFGWVHGSGTPGGLIAEMMAAAMNANLGGRDHGAIYVERQVVDWCRQIFDFPDEASGLIVSGTSMATLIALKVARDNALSDYSDHDMRLSGLPDGIGNLVAYAGEGSHSSVAKAFDMLGLGEEHLRIIPDDDLGRMDLSMLNLWIKTDTEIGNTPFCIIGTAGSASTGAIDNLRQLGKLCEKLRLWFHVDGAFGAPGILSEDVRPLLDGLEFAHSIALDFHKWMHVNYDAGLVLIRDGELHRKAFTARPDYLAAEDQGLAGGNPWPCEYGPELSRSFRALKVWFAIKEHGLARIGEKISDNCRQARHLAALVEAHESFELLRPVTLNIVCFRYRAKGMDEEALDGLNRKIVIALQERGLAAPSTTRILSKLAIRVNITNHRTTLKDMDEFLADCAIIGHELAAGPE